MAKIISDKERVPKLDYATPKQPKRQSNRVFVRIWFVLCLGLTIDFGGGFIFSILDIQRSGVRGMLLDLMLFVLLCWLTGKAWTAAWPPRSG